MRRSPGRRDRGVRASLGSVAKKRAGGSRKATSRGTFGLGVRRRKGARKTNLHGLPARRPDRVARRASSGKPPGDGGDE
jgi:hypothetical protein